jgi:hypothetical protein
MPLSGWQARHGARAASTAASLVMVSRSSEPRKRIRMHWVRWYLAMPGTTATWLLTPRADSSLALSATAGPAVPGTDSGLPCGPGPAASGADGRGPAAASGSSVASGSGTVGSSTAAAGSAGPGSGAVGSPAAAADSPGPVSPGPVSAEAVSAEAVSAEAISCGPAGSVSAAVALGSTGPPDPDVTS